MRTLTCFPSASSFRKWRPDNHLSLEIPRWSPDGRQIAFVAQTPGKPYNVFVVSAGGGVPEQLTHEENILADVSWSADGGKLVFGAFGASPEAQTFGVRVLDLKTHQVSMLPGSEGLFSPRWSPDGRYILAVSADSKKLALFDVAVRRWRNWRRQTRAGASRIGARRGVCLG